VHVSKEANTQYHNNKNKRVYYESPYPIDRSDCQCQPILAKIKKREHRPYLTCPRATEPKMARYSLTCKECKSLVAYVYATDTSLTDWCDLHYLCSHDADYWSGAMAVNISPIDQHIGIECACGQDTRDFRANTTLPPQQALAIETENSKGRAFGKRTSKFIVKKYK